MDGASAGRPSSAVADMPQELKDLPAFFLDILRDLKRHQSKLGGIRNFHDYPQIRGKVTADDFKAGYTDFEYAFLQVVGFARLHQHVDEIVRMNNGKTHAANPGTQRLEQLCGFTMHGDRPGSDGVLRSAGPSLLEAFQVSRTTRGGTGEFFRVAFDRKADPCLEGRVSRLLEYLEKHRHASSSSVAPWEDVSLRPLPESATPTDIVGEHLRVFMGECTWKWGSEKGLSYEDAKNARLVPEHSADFERVFNASTFLAALRSKGVVADSHPARWEIGMGQGERWVPYDRDVNREINDARARGQPQVEVRLGPKRWRFQIDMCAGCQRNPHTGVEHKIRCVRGDSGFPQWEASLEAQDWTPYEERVSSHIEQAYQRDQQVVQVVVGPKTWKYDVDLRKNLQRNPETGKERSVRRVQPPGVPKGKVSSAQAAEAVRYFVDLCTLPEALT